MSTTRFLAVVGFIAVIAATPPVTAQDDEGVRLNETAITLFQQGEYRESAETFARAYELLREPVIRKSEAIAWFRADDCEKASVAANKFLLIQGTSESDRADVTSVLANCRVHFAREAIASGDYSLAEEFLRKAEELEPDRLVVEEIGVARLELARAQKAEADAETAAAEQPDADEPISEMVDAPEPEPRPDVLAWSLIGSGGAVVLGTVVYHAAALGWQNEVIRMADEGGGPQRFDSLKKRVSVARVMVPVLYAVGVATAGAGVYFLVAPEQNADGERGTTISLGWSATFRGL